MIRIGKLLIDPDGIDTILSTHFGQNETLKAIQIIYKSGVVKNLRSDEIGISYNDFINEFEKVTKQAEDKRILRLMAAFKPA